MTMLFSEELAQQWRELQDERSRRTIKVLSVTAMRAVFSQTVPGERMAQRREILSGIEGISLLPSIMISPETTIDEIIVIAAKAKAQGAACVEILLGNYGCEDQIARLIAELNLPASVYAPCDGPPEGDGKRLTDGWCGIMPVTKLLSDKGLRYIVPPHCEMGSPQDIAATNDFFSAARAIKAIRDSRIGQIGNHADTFTAIRCDVGALDAQFGIDVVSIEMTTLRNLILNLEDEEFEMLAAEIEEMQARFDMSAIPPAAITRIAAAKIALLKMAVEMKLDGITTRCWAEIMEDMGLMMCIPNGELLRLGIPISCETDLGGLLSLMMGQAFHLDGDPMAFADITIAIFDENSRTWKILVWHCGPFPCTLCGKCNAKQGYIIPTIEPAFAYLDGVVQRDYATLMRLCNSGGQFSLAALEAPIVEGPKTEGTHFWIEPDDFQMLHRRLTMGDGLVTQGKATVHHFGVSFAKDAVLIALVGQFLNIPVTILEPEEGEIMDRMLYAELNHRAQV